jgi:hypothetical protein
VTPAEGAALSGKADLDVQAAFRPGIRLQSCTVDADDGQHLIM